MLPMRVEDITGDDILRLVADNVGERKTLEYKAQLTIGTGDEKAEFCSDISSFANASGGDIIFGISDARDEKGQATGYPAEISPLNIANIATECGKIEQLIDSGIQPRIPVKHVQPIDVPGVGLVIVIRVGKSWISPHMVTHSNRSRFYSRNSSTGKVQLDVQQIGAAFAAQRGVGERLTEWKAGRIGKAIAGESPALLQGSSLLLHFVSAESLMSDASPLPRVFDTHGWGKGQRLFSLSMSSVRYNADGILLQSEPSDRHSGSYLQVFRNGNLEYGDSYSLGEDYVPSGGFEEKLIRTFETALILLRLHQVVEPLYASLTLIGMKGITMALPPRFSPQFSLPFDRDVILSPDIQIQSLSEPQPYLSTLLPIVNSVWQAAGRERSPYISRDDIWRTGDY